jgi:membrane protease YdiL (CAAX protease family)
MAMLPSAPATASPVAPPSWYPDPWYPGQQRWWDGSAWTAHVTPGGWVVTPGPYAAYGATPPDRAWFPDIATLRSPAAIFGIALVGILLAGNFAITATQDNDLTSGLIALAVLAFYAVGLPLGAWFASRKWGSGHFIADLGFRLKPIDLALGVAGAVTMLITVVVVGLLMRGFGVPERSNLKDVVPSHQTLAVFIFLVVQAGILAPFTEELLFRGVVLRGLSSKLRTVAAIAVQALIFGMAHVSLDGGWGNVGLAIALACVGAELGYLARSTGRLGAGMIAHGLFNTTQIVLLFVLGTR